MGLCAQVLRSCHGDLLCFLRISYWQALIEQGWKRYGSDPIGKQKTVILSFPFGLEDFRLRIQFMMMLC